MNVWIHVTVLIRLLRSVSRSILTLLMSVCVSVCVCRTICTTHYPATPLTYTGALIETSLKDDVALDTQTQPLFVLTRAACHNYTTAATVFVLVQYLHIALYGPLHPTPVLTLVCVCVCDCVVLQAITWRIRAIIDVTVRTVDVYRGIKRG